MYDEILDDINEILDTIKQLQDMQDRIIAIIDSQQTAINATANAIIRGDKCYEDLKARIEKLEKEGM